VILIMNFFPWKKGTTLHQAVIAGIPAPAAQPAKGKRPPTTEAALAARAKNCKRIAARTKRQLNEDERDRYAETISHVLKHSNIRGHSSRVFRSLLGWELGAEMAERLGLPSHRERREALERSAKEWEIFNATASKNDEAPAKPAAPAVKDWRARYDRQMAYDQDRIRREDLVADAALEHDPDIALKIINSGKTRRGEKPIDKWEMQDPGDRRIKPDRRR
jgi:hypothetical protein